MLLFKGIWIYSILRLGLIPGHDLSMYLIPDHQEWLNINTTYYIDYDIKINIHRYFEIHGGMTSFSFKTMDGLDFYPLRMDYKFGISLEYNCLSIQYDYGCFHPITPLCSSSPLPKLDAAQHNISIKCIIGKEPK